MQGELQPRRRLHLRTHIFGGFRKFYYLCTRLRIPAMRLRLLYILLALLFGSLGSGAASGPKMKYPGGKYYICR